MVEENNNTAKRISSFITSYGGIGTLLAIVATGAVTINSYREKVDQAQVAVEFLTRQVSELQGTINGLAKVPEGKPGPQGIKGDQGDPGPRGFSGAAGERGPLGPAGRDGAPGGSGLRETEVRALIDSIVSQRFANLPQKSSSPGAVDVANALPLFDTSHCVQLDSIRLLPVLTVKSKTEVCRKDGSLIGRITDVDENGISIMISGTGSEGCSIDSICKLSIFGNRNYLYERHQETDDGSVALLRKIND